jgi:glutamate racemase
MKRPIGVFDSGLGGLTVVKQLRRLMPGEDIIYFGDTARVPYGNKSRRAVTRFSRENSRFLLSRGVKMIIVACNTSSALAFPALKSEFEVPLYDVITPGVRKAIELTRTGKLGIIGTYATIHSGAYEREIAKLDGSLTVHSMPCPLFVPLAEEGWVNRPATVEIAREYLLPLGGKGIDVLILGCTHYPVLKETIRLVLGEGITLVDSGLSCAELVREEMHPEAGEGRGSVRYFVSDMPERFKEVGRLFMGEEIPDVEVVVPGSERGALS